MINHLSHSQWSNYDYQLFILGLCFISDFVMNNDSEQLIPFRREPRYIKERLSRVIIGEKSI